MPSGWFVRLMKQLVPTLLMVMFAAEPLLHWIQQASGFVSVKVKFTYTQLLLVLELFARVGAESSKSWGGFASIPTKSLALEFTLFAESLMKKV